MEIISTRDKNFKTDIITAITQNLAPDGGLYVPKELPTIQSEDFLNQSGYAEFSAQLLNLFFKNTPIESHLLKLCKNAFSFGTPPLRQLSENTYLLELFHGPTLSFKDFGARFLAECLNQLSYQQKRTVMVATSGDTGSAVASAFCKKSNMYVIVLFPKDKITKRQQQQITCWNENILAIAIHGIFDDCQALVKAAFSSPEWKSFHLTSANSINLGRLLPQIAYYAFSSMQFYKKTNHEINFIVPSGNLGNVTAAYWAKTIGFPINKIAISCNANHVLSDYLATGKFQPKPAIETLANAMDVGNPSNFERLDFLFGSYETFKNQVIAESVSDENIRAAIKDAYQRYNRIICPHTATAYFLRQQFSAQEPWAIAATADPCKFETIIEPILHKSIPIPSQLNEMLNQSSYYIEADTDLEKLKVIVNQLYFKNE